MSRKRALIVDDSKSARVVLGRMLQKYDIDVDTAESAETAIDYLRHNSPDVIFMDHLMPGMDGFQAVQAIKSNPQTATIPIMMYTSQEGELYVGQARALGAVGVLPKLVKPVDVSKVLYQLHLLPDRRDRSPPAFVDAEVLAAAAGAGADAAGVRTVLTDTQLLAGLVPADWQPQLQSALREHDAELRRFFTATLDSVGDRTSAHITGQVRELIEATPALQTPPPRTPPYLWIAALILALMPGIVFGVFYLRTLDGNHALAASAAQLEQNNTQLAAAVERLTTREAAQSQRLAVASVLGVDGAGENAGSQDVLIEPVPYGEAPLALDRVEVLRDLLARLREQGFRGQLRIKAFRGQFCLAGSPTEGYALAPSGLAAGECDLIGNPHADALSPAQRESLPFANLVSGVSQREGEVQVEVLYDGERAAEPYPPPTRNATAGEWNAVAARNNRVEFTLIPAS
jgi:CheY-like chemotaxis protein